MKKANRWLKPSELIIVSEWLDKKKKLAYSDTWPELNCKMWACIFLPKSLPDVRCHVYINCISHSVAFDCPVMVKSRVCGLNDGEKKSEEPDSHFRHVSLLPHSPSALLAFGCSPEEFSGGLCKYNIKNNSTSAPVCGLNPVPGSLLRCPWLCWVE